MSEETQKSTNTPAPIPGLSFWGWPAWLALGIFLLDQVTKIAVDHCWEVGHLQPVIDTCFNLVHYRNTGAAWGMFGDHTWILGLLSLAALVLVIVFFKSQNQGNKGYALGLSLLAGGIAGNMVDRIFRGSVIDFLDFYIGTSHWPAFNIADSAICVAVGLLILYSYLSDRSKKSASK